MRRTMTGSTGKLPLADTPGERGVERGAERRLVEVAPHDTLGHETPAIRVGLAEEPAPGEHAMGEDNRGILEDDDVDHVGSEPSCRVLDQRQPLAPTGIGTQRVSKHNGKIDIRSRSGAFLGARPEEVDGRHVRVGRPRAAEGFDTRVEIGWKRAIGEHA